MRIATEVVVIFAGSLATTLFVSFLLAWPVMMLWNGCLVGAVDSVREISWLQAWGLKFLCSIPMIKRTSK